MMSNRYRPSTPPPLHPEYPGEEELKLRRKRVNTIGSIAGIGAGVGGGYYWHRKHPNSPMYKTVPKLVAIVAAGYGVGTAGAYLYNDIFNRGDEEDEMRNKHANDINEIANMNIPDDKKRLLLKSKGYIRGIRSSIVADLVNRAETEEMPDPPRPLVGKKKSVRPPIVMYSKKSLDK